MGFLSPLFALGLAAGFIPIAIHLIGKRRAERVPFAALDFLLRSNRRLRRRLRLRQRLLLLFRVMLFIAVALVLMRPYAEVQSALPAMGRAPVDAVLILDDSASMRGLYGGETLFVAAKRRAAAILEALPPGSLAAVLRSSDPTSPEPRLIGDRRRLREAIAGLEVGYGAASLQEALGTAAALLRGRRSRGHCFVISDLTRWALPPGGLGAPGVGHFHRVLVGSAAGLVNRAVVRLTAGVSNAPGYRSLRFMARVCRFASASSKGTHGAKERLLLRLDGKIVAEANVTLPPSGCVEASFDHTFARVGLHRAVVSLNPDALPVDDQRYLDIHVASELRVALVDGAPSPLRYKDELYYLRTALETVVAGRRPIRTRTLTPQQVSGVRAAAFDVIVLANVEDLSPEGASVLTTFVRGGGGLFVTLGDNVRASRYAARFGALLPRRLRGEASASATVGSATALHFGRSDGDHPIIAAMGGGLLGLSRARVSRSFRLRPSSRTGGRVWLRYDDGSPALVEGRAGKGRIILLTTSVDRDWTDLPIRPGFLPLMQGVIRYLAGVTTRRGHVAKRVGDEIAIQIPPGVRRLHVVDPGGQERTWARTDADAKWRVRWRLDRPGFYRVSTVDARGRATPRPQMGFAANLDPREADTTRGDPGVDAKGPKVAAKSRATTRQVPLGHAIGIVLLFLLLGESWLTRPR